MKKITTILTTFMLALASVMPVNAADTKIWGTVEHSFFSTEKVVVTVSTKALAYKISHGTGNMSDITKLKAEFADVNKCAAQPSVWSPDTLTYRLDRAVALKTACQNLITKYVPFGIASLGLQTHAYKQWDTNEFLAIRSYGTDQTNRLIRQYSQMKSDWSYTGPVYLFAVFPTRGYLMVTAGRTCGTVTKAALDTSVTRAVNIWNGVGGFSPKITSNEIWVMTKADFEKKGATLQPILRNYDYVQIDAAKSRVVGTTICPN